MKDKDGRMRECHGSGVGDEEDGDRDSNEQY